MAALKIMSSTQTQMPIARDAEQSVCPICHGAGFVRLDVPLDHPLFGKAVPCVCKRVAIQEKRLADLRKASNLQHLQKMTFDSFQTDGHGSLEVSEALREALGTARQYAVSPSGWVVFTGTYGCGKTHLAAAIANHRVGQGLPVLFVVVPDLLDYLRASYAPNSPTTYDERFNQVRDVELLILDDLGTQHATPWAAEKLYQLLNYRYNAELPTVITTNQSPDAMDPRLASRLRNQELVDTIPIFAPDWRIRSKGDTFGSLSLYEAQTFEAFRDRRDELEAQQAADLRKAVRTAKAYATNPVNWLLLRGGYGVGKTHLAAAVANKLVRSGISALFVVVPDLLDHLRATFRPGSAVSYDERFNEVRRARLLVLDDLGTQNATPWAEEKLFQILNYRHAAGLPTVLTVSDDGWERLDERLKSRLLDATVCTTVIIDTPSYRGKPPSRRRPRRTTRRRT